MPWKWRLIVIALVLVLFGVLAFIIKFQHDLLAKNQALRESFVEMKELQQGWVRNSSRYVTKGDMDRYADDLGVDLGPIRADLKTLEAEVKGLSYAVARSKKVVKKDVGSTSTTPREGHADVDVPDPFGYQTNAQTVTLMEETGEERVPIGEVEFRAWKERPWSYELKAREYSAITVISVDDDGKTIVTNQLLVKVDGQEFPLAIEEGKFVEIYPEGSFKFHPRLFLAFDAGAYVTQVAAELTLDAEISFFSYGKTKLSPDWVFLSPGLGYATQRGNMIFSLAPARYNLGSVLPLIENLYVGPKVTVDLEGNVGIYAGVAVGL